VLLQQPARVRVGGVEDPHHLLVDLAGGLVAAVALEARQAAAQQLRTGGPGTVGQPHGLAHAVHGHHLPHQGGRLVEVVLGAGGHLAQHQLLRRPPAHQAAHLVEERRARQQVLVAGGELHGVAEGRPAAGHDGDLVDRVGVLAEGRHHRVPALVDRHAPLVLFGEAAAAALGARHHALHGLLQVARLHPGVALARRQQGRLVHHVGQVRAGHAGGGAGHPLEVRIRRQRLAPGVDAQDGQAAVEVGRVEQHLAVEAPGAQQRSVQDLRPVGGREHDHAGVGLEAVHLHEELVQRLLALLVHLAHGDAAGATDGVELVDEDDAGRLLLGLLEEVAHARGSHAHEHLHELAAGELEEGHARLAGHGAGEQRLAGAGRPHQQHALRDAGAQGLVAVRPAQEAHHLLEVALGLVAAGHVVEAHAGLAVGHDARAAAAEAHGLLAHATRPEAAQAPQQEDPHQHQQPDGEQPREDLRPAPGRGPVVAHAVGLEGPHQVGVLHAHGLEGELLGRGALRGSGALAAEELGQAAEGRRRRRLGGRVGRPGALPRLRLLRVAVAADDAPSDALRTHGGLDHLAARQVLLELAVGDGATGGLAGEAPRPQQQQREAGVQEGREPGAEAGRGGPAVVGAGRGGVVAPPATPGVAGGGGVPGAPVGAGHGADAPVRSRPRRSPRRGPRAPPARGAPAAPPPPRSRAGR